MKTMIKQMLAAVILMTALPVFAAENDNTAQSPTKGTKSYQSAKMNAENSPTRAENTAQTNPADIETAAGAMDEPAQKDQNSLSDDLRLPRKN